MTQPVTPKLAPTVVVQLTPLAMEQLQKAKLRSTETRRSVANRILQTWTGELPPPYRLAHYLPDWRANDRGFSIVVPDERLTSLLNERFRPKMWNELGLEKKEKVSLVLNYLLTRDL